MGNCDRREAAAKVMHREKGVSVSVQVGSITTEKGYNIYRKKTAVKDA